MNKFEVVSEFQPKGDQPNAIKELKKGDIIKVKVDDPKAENDIDELTKQIKIKIKLAINNIYLLVINYNFLIFFSRYFPFYIHI